MLGLLPRILDLVKREDSYPTDTAARVELAAGGARELVVGEEKLWILPVRISFSAVTNSYCRLVLADLGTSRIGLVPQLSDINTCKRMDLEAETDLNEDGLPDLVFSVHVQSNRSEAVVMQDATFFSVRRPLSYCYAARADLTGIYGTDNIRATIAAQVARWGKGVFDCYSGLADGGSPSNSAGGRD